MNYIVILSQYGLTSIRSTISQMHEPVSVLIKRTDNSWKRLEKEGSPKRIPSLPNFMPNDKVIRWGNSIPLSGSFISYNSPKSTSIASNKGEFRNVMMANEIPIPDPYHPERNQWPVIIRPNHHHAGQHFHIANNKAEYDKAVFRLGGISNCYASQFYPKQREVRVHCCSGKVLLMKEKPAPEDKSIVAWNFAVNEEAWTTIDRQNYDPNICLLALRAMDAIGLDMGGVDIMFDPIDEKMPKYVVCEINTAPSLTDYLSQKYAAYFDKLFRTEGKLQNWDYNQFTKGKSFSWKNEQLNA